MKEYLTNLYTLEKHIKELVTSDIDDIKNDEGLISEDDLHEFVSNLADNMCIYTADCFKIVEIAFFNPDIEHIYRNANEMSLDDVDFDKKIVSMAYWIIHDIVGYITNEVCKEYIEA
tara:strand:+ start:2060 stop:2410 length:351 start_codon:yes stop_codon:yes gene_type:complete